MICESDLGVFYFNKGYDIDSPVMLNDEIYALNFIDFLIKFIQEV